METQRMSTSAIYHKTIKFVDWRREEIAAGQLVESE